MTPTWTYDAGLWHLSIAPAGRIYAIASNRRPTQAETRRILTRLLRFYPWLVTVKAAA